MHAKDTFSQAQLRLQAAGCRYRIKQAPRSPYIQVYDTLPPRRQQAARGFRVDDDQACWDLAAGAYQERRPLVVLLTASLQAYSAKEITGFAPGT